MRSKSKSDRDARNAERRRRDAARRAAAKARRGAMRHTVPDQHQVNPLLLYRVGRLSEIFDCDRSTVWRMRKSGQLPPPAFTGPFEAWTHEQLKTVLARRSGGR